MLWSEKVCLSNYKFIKNVTSLGKTIYFIELTVKVISDF